MNEKLKKYLKLRSMSDLATLRGLVSSICKDYDVSLTNYATMNDDKAFAHMPADVRDMHERRNKLFSLLMYINSVIEEKLFKLYEA